MANKKKVLLTLLVTPPASIRTRRSPKVSSLQTTIFFFFFFLIVPRFKNDALGTTLFYVSTYFSQKLVASVRLDAASSLSI